jgi:hypothetical protein
MSKAKQATNQKLVGQNQLNKMASMAPQTQ